MDEAKAKILMREKSQELLCRRCLWKHMIDDDKILCFLRKCLYEETSYTPHGAYQACIEYTSRFEKQRVQYNLRIKNGKATEDFID